MDATQQLAALVTWVGAEMAKAKRYIEKFRDGLDESDPDAKGIYHVLYWGGVTYESVAKERIFGALAENLTHLQERRDEGRTDEEILDGLRTYYVRHALEQASIMQQSSNPLSNLMADYERTQYARIARALNSSMIDVL